jgi:hypothetical protein
LHVIFEYILAEIRRSRESPRVDGGEMSLATQASSNLYRLDFLSGNTIAYQARSHRFACDAHSASDNSPPLAISPHLWRTLDGAFRAHRVLPERRVDHVDRAAGSSSRGAIATFQATAT